MHIENVLFSLKLICLFASMTLCNVCILDAFFLGD